MAMAMATATGMPVEMLIMGTDRPPAWRLATAVLLGAVLLGAASLLPALAADDLDQIAKELKNPDKYKRSEAVKRLGGVAGERATSLLIDQLADREAIVRDWAIDLLRKRKDDTTAPLLAKLGLGHKEARARVRSADVLADRQAKDQAPTLLKAALADKLDAPSRAAAVRALGRLGDQASYDGLVKELKGAKEEELRIELIESIALLGKEKSTAILQPLLDRAQWQDKVMIIRALGLADRAAALQAAIAQRSDRVWQVRSRCIETLGDSAHQGAVEPLIASLEKEDGRLRHDAFLALVKLTGQEDLDDSLAAWKDWWSVNKDKFAPGAAKRNAQAKELATRVDYHGLPIWSNHVAFLIDLSGSMKEPVGGEGEGKERTKAEAALQELIRTIGALEKGQDFEICLFQTEPLWWKKKLVPVSAQAKQEAVTWLNGRKTPQHWSNYFDALVGTSQIPGVDTIFILTDGEPSVGEYKRTDLMLEKYIELNRYRRVQVHTIKIGVLEGDRAKSDEKRAEEFMKKLAESTGGRYAART